MTFPKTSITERMEKTEPYENGEDIAYEYASDVFSTEVVTRGEASTAQGKDAAAERGVASTRGARRFATRGARRQALARMTPAEREAFWTEEARRCGFPDGKFGRDGIASAALLIA